MNKFNTLRTIVLSALFACATLAPAASIIANQPKKVEIKEVPVYEMPEMTIVSADAPTTAQAHVVTIGEVRIVGNANKPNKPASKPATLSSICFRHALVQSGSEWVRQSGSTGSVLVCGI